MIAVEGVEIEVTEFGSTSKEYLRFFICEQGEGFDNKLRCGFYDFCLRCDKRYQCATERK